MKFGQQYTVHVTHQSQYSIFTLESDHHALWDVVAGQHWHPNAKVGIHAIFKL